VDLRAAALAVVVADAVAEAVVAAAEAVLAVVALPRRLKPARPSI